MNLRLFELYADYIWPLQRRFIRGLSKRCSNCLLSEKYTTLASDGLCDLCRHAPAGAPSASPASDELARRFDATLKAHTGKGRHHDALFLLSGGKDSAYLLDRFRKEYPALRVLAATIDNGFLAPVALSNAAWTASQLGVEYEVVRSAIPRFAKELRQAFLNLNGRGAYEVVDFTDGNLIFETGKNLAKERGIPLMIGGLSWVQLEKIFNLKDAFEEPGATEPRVIYPLGVWRVDEQEIRAYVRDKGLIPSGKDSPLVTNSRLVTPMCVVDMLTLGYCSFEPEFAQLVREKKTDRRLWLRIYELLEYGVRTGRLVKEADNTLRELDLTINDIIQEKK